MNRNWWSSGRWAEWAGFGPWGRRFFDAGEVRLAILSLVRDEPRHGYELIKELRARSGGAYRASAGAIYPALQQLEDEGLLGADTRDGRRIYRVTERGQAALDLEEAAVRDIWKRARDWQEWSAWMGPATAGLSAPIAALVKSALGVAARHPTRDGDVRGILDRARAEIEGLNEPD
jgi:DNA-binding PadR family transcriptional regulator